MSIISFSGKINSGKDTCADIVRYLTSSSGISKGSFTTCQEMGYVYDVSYSIEKFADKLKDITCLLIGCTRKQLEDREFKESPLPKEWDKWGVLIEHPDESTKLYGVRFATEEEAKEFEKNERRALQWGDDLKTSIVSVSMTPRKLLQLLGTEAGRRILHPNIWVNALMSDYKTSGFGNEKAAVLEFPKWIISDTRFPNEADAVKEKGGINIRINRPYFYKFDEKEDKHYWSNISDFETGKVVAVNGNLTKEESKEIFLKEFLETSHASETALDDYEDFDYIIENDGSLEALVQKVKLILEKENII